MPSTPNENPRSDERKAAWWRACTEAAEVTLKNLDTRLQGMPISTQREELSRNYHTETERFGEWLHVFEADDIAVQRLKGTLRQQQYEGCALLVR